MIKIRWQTKLKLNSKMLIYILSTCVIIFGVSIGYVSYKAKQNALVDALEIADLLVREHGKKVEAELNSDMDIARSIAVSFKSYYKFPVKQRMGYYKSILSNFAEENPEYLSVWAIWELRATDTTWLKPYGRGRYTFYRESGTLFYKEEVLNTEGDNLESAYYKIKVSKLESVIDPYTFSYTGNASDLILETSLCIPILKNAEFYGLVGIDLPLDRYKSMIDQIRPFPGSFAFLIANDGTVLAHSNQSFVGRKVNEVFRTENETFKIMQKIKETKTFSYQITDSINGVQKYISYVPIVIGKSITPWSFGISVPVKVVMQKANKAFLVSALVALFGLFLVSAVIWFIARYITMPLIDTTNTLKILAQGAVDQAEELEIKSGDEIGEMASSVNRLVEGLRSTAEFARQIGDGNLNAEYNVLSKNDLLGNSLLEMRRSLKHAEQEEQKRKIEDEKQNWNTKGIAKFGELLRQNNNNLEELSFSIIGSLVNYLDANQGSIFIINDTNPDDIFFEQKAAIAFDRRKLLKKQIRIGEELIGRCIHEKLTIYMIDVPENYVKITSGLGEANPRCVLLVPLKLNNEVYGVLEIVSFKTMEPYQIEFVEKIGESIASTVSSVRVNEKTAFLLEQAQMQREELASKEEEMRQSLEELQATQEESARREMEMAGLWNALNSVASVVEFDMKGTIININDRNLQVVGATREQMVGRNLAELAAEAKNDPAAYKRFWDDLRMGRTKHRNFHETVNGEDMWISETYAPILDSNGTPVKVLSIGIDITPLKKTESQFKEELEVAWREIEIQKKKYKGNS